MKTKAIITRILMIILPFSGNYIFIKVLSIRNTLFANDFIISTNAARDLIKGISPYTERMLFPNTTMACFIVLPYCLFEYNISLILKCIIAVIAIFINILFLIKTIPLRIRNDIDFFFLIAVMLTSFTAFHLIFLNFYFENTLIIIALILLYFNNYKKISGALIAFLVAVKAFLFPIALLPLLLKEREMSISMIISGISIALISVILFGFNIHLDMLNAVINHYSQHSYQGARIPILAPYGGGFMDLLHRLEYKNLFQYKYVKPATLIINIIFLIITGAAALKMSRIYGCINKTINKQQAFLGFAGTLIFLSMSYQYRADWGFLFFPAIPFIMGISKLWIRRGIIFSIALSTFNPVLILAYTGQPLCVNMAEQLNRFLYFFPFPFICINIITALILIYWFRYAQEEYRDRENSDLS